MDTLIKVKSGAFLIKDKNETRRKLTELLDWLLAILMNGQMRVSDLEVDEMMEMAVVPVGEYKVKI